MRSRIHDSGGFRCHLSRMIKFSVNADATRLRRRKSSIRSLASYSFMSFLLQWKDRHTDNSLFDTGGGLIAAAHLHREYCRHFTIATNIIIFNNSIHSLYLFSPLLPIPIHSYVRRRRSRHLPACIFVPRPCTCRRASGASRFFFCLAMLNCITRWVLDICCFSLECLQYQK